MIQIRQYSPLCAPTSLWIDWHGNGVWRLARPYKEPRDCEPAEAIQALRDVLRCWTRYTVWVDRSFSPGEPERLATAFFPRGGPLSIRREYGMGEFSDCPQDGDALVRDLIRILGGGGEEG